MVIRPFLTAGLPTQRPLPFALFVCYAPHRLKVMSSESKSRVLYENLDTSFVNLWDLLRHLSRQKFVGRVHVEMDDYEADVFLTGSNTPLVREIDRAAGTDVLEEAAMHRLVLRARESPGKISVFEGAAEAVAVKKSTPETVAKPPSIQAGVLPAESEIAQASFTASASVHSGKPVKSDVDSAAPAASAKSFEAADEGEVLRTGGELIGAVERALTGAGADFPSLFRAARIALADDYPFLDPVSGFDYANSTVTMNNEFAGHAFIAGVSEALRRVVDHAAQGDRARRIRERVALDLAVAARKQKGALERSGFDSQLDHIAGTKVI